MSTPSHSEDATSYMPVALVFSLTHALPKTMTIQDAKLLGKAVTNVEKNGDEPGTAVALHGDTRSVVIYVLQNAYAFSFYDTKSAARREARSPSLSV